MGSFSLSGLAPGSDTVYVDPSCYGTNRSNVYAKQVIDAVLVTADQNTVISIPALSIFGSITGTVLSPTSANLSGVCVYAINTSSGQTMRRPRAPMEFIRLRIWRLVPTTCISIQPATTPSSRLLAAQLQTGETVTSGQTTLVGIQLVNAGTISGEITSSSIGVSGVCVSATSTGVGGTDSATTESDGTYEIYGLYPATYSIQVDPSCNNTVSTTLASVILPTSQMVTGGGAITGVDDALTAGPGAPTITSASAGNSSASISWTAGATNGSAITGYTVNDSYTSYNGSSYSTTTASNVCTGSTTSTATSCVISGLINGQSYTFSVAAINGVGTGAFSGASSAVTPSATTPGTPTIGTVVAGNASVTVNWSAPSSNGGSSLTGYTVTSTPAVTTPAACSTSLSGSSTSCVFTGLTNGRELHLQRRGRQRCGNGKLLERFVECHARDHAQCTDDRHGRGRQRVGHR